jgi:hypothetical protein
LFKKIVGISAKEYRNKNIRYSTEH